MDKNVVTGWGQAFFAVLVLWSISNVFLGYSVRTQGADPIVYSCVVFTSASLVLLAYSGYGKLAKETMRSIDTWGYGFSLMLNYIVLLALLAMVTSTEATLLQSIAVVVSLLTGWFFMGRAVSKGQALGALVIVTGLFMVLSDLQVDNLGYIILLIIAMGIIQTIRTYIAEFHRPHQYAASQLVSAKDKARVVALVMFVVSTLFFVFFLGFALLMHFVEGVTIPAVPTIADFLNPYTVVFGMVAGVLLIAPLRYFEFSATHAIKTENYLAVSAFAPVATWAWEWGTAPITGINMRQLTEVDAIACAFITLGGLAMAVSRMKSDSAAESMKKHICVEAQNIVLVEDSREIVANTLEHFNSDVKSAAAALGLPQNIITAFLEDSEKVVAFKNFPDVARSYRKHVAMADGLTGLANRSAFMTALRSAAYEAEVYTVVYIDLDKFKPVNDTYGHETGDKVLQGIAERLTEVAPKNTVITRMGGDEYCMLLLDTAKESAEKLVPEIQNAVAKPFNFDGIDDEVSVSASIGIASYPEDGDNPEELLNIADKGMFSAKGESGR